MQITKSIEVIPSDPALFQRRRVQIALAAMSIFANQGFHKTTVREIAKAAGASVGTLYEYFSNKEDILCLACEETHRELETALQVAISQHSDPLEKLKVGIDKYYRVIAGETDRVLLIYREPQSMNAEGRQMLMRREQDLTRIFDEILVEGVKKGVFQIDDAKLVSQNIILLGHMWGLKRWTLHKHLTIERFIKLQTDFILSAVLPTQAGSPKP